MWRQDLLVPELSQQISKLKLDVLKFQKLGLIICGLRDLLDLSPSMVFCVLGKEISRNINGCQQTDGQI